MQDRKAEHGNGNRIPDDYGLTVLKAVQAVFANLLGSEFRCYAPKYFWKHFR